MEEFAWIIRKLTLFNIDNDLAHKVDLINQVLEYLETLEFEQNQNYGSVYYE